MVKKSASHLYFVSTCIIISLFPDLGHYISLLLPYDLVIFDLPSDLHLLLNQVLCMHKSLHK
jgi:hypothetical protein